MPGDGSSRQYVVLLVDDDLRTARRMADMLREDGFAVEIARDGAAAIARLSRSPAPDALVTELTTAHADGVAVGRFARSQRPGLPVFLVTGYPNLFDPAVFASSPPALLFTKPVGYADLRDALQGALRVAEATGTVEKANCQHPSAAPALESALEDARRDTLSGAQTLRALRRP